MTSSFSVFIKKYSVPVLFFAFGIALLVAGIKSKQDSMFMIASVLMFAASIMSVLYSSGKMKASILYIIGVVAGIGALVTIYFSWQSVDETSTYNKNYQKCKAQAIQNLTDIRYAQKMYAEKNGTYAKDWPTLVDYIKNGTVPYVESEGVVPGRKLTPEESKYIYHDNRPIDVNMTEIEAYILSKTPICPPDLKGFKRDTIQVSLMQSKFSTKSNLEARKKAGFGKFYADSLPYIPYTGGKKMWKMKTADSVFYNDAYYPAIEVSGEIPFAKIQGTGNEPLSFGKLTTNETAGSWEDE